MSRRVILVGAIDDEHNRLLKIADTYRGGGWDVRFIGMDRYRRRPRRCVKAGLECEYLLHGFGQSNWRLTIGYPIWAVLLFFRVLSCRASLIHVFELETAIGVALAASVRGIPFLYDVQDNYELRHNWPRPVRWAIRALDRFVLRRAASLIVPDACRLTGVLAEGAASAVVIPNCPPDLTEGKVRQVGADGVVVVLAMGHLAERRGVGLLLDAAERVPGIRVTMAGRFTELWLEERARSSPKVSVLGWVDWKEAVCLGLRADVVFTFYDPRYPVNILANAQKWYDAMMSGTPILVNDAVRASDWLERRGAAYRCEYSADGIEGALRRIAAEPEEAQRRGRCGRKLFEQEFNWTVMGARLLAAAEKSVSVQPA